MVILGKTALAWCDIMASDDEELYALLWLSKESLRLINKILTIKTEVYTYCQYIQL